MVPSDTQLLVHSAEGVADDVKLVPELLHHAVDAGSVLEDVHTLGVRVVSYGEGTLDGLGELPEMSGSFYHLSVTVCERGLSLRMCCI